jgi:hypothetical protein
MSGDDLIVIVDQHWVAETKAFDAVGDLTNLLAAVGARVVGVGAECADRHCLDMHCLLPSHLLASGAAVARFVSPNRLTFAIGSQIIVTFCGEGAMGNKGRDEPRIYKRIDALILLGLPNLEVWAKVRSEFADARTTKEQVRRRREQLRARFANIGGKSVPSSVEARRRQKAKRESHLATD